MPTLSLAALSTTANWVVAATSAAALVAIAAWTATRLAADIGELVRQHRARAAWHHELRRLDSHIAQLHRELDASRQQMWELTWPQLEHYARWGSLDGYCDTDGLLRVELEQRHDALTRRIHTVRDYRERHTPQRLS